MKPGNYVAVLVENEDGTSSVTFFPERENDQAAKFGAAMSGLSFVEFTTAMKATIHTDGQLEMRIPIHV